MRDMLIFFIISFLTGLLYFISIYQYFKSWDSSEEYLELPESDIYLSIVVPFFNAERYIEKLFSDFSNLDFPGNKYEVLFINDHSTDQSPQLARKLAEKHENFICLDNFFQKGKKYAIRSGVEKASSDIIITTDADCRIPSKWLTPYSGIISKYSDSVLISSGVIMDKGQKFLHGFQALDFSSLVASGAASFLVGSPIMCNGANLAFKKSLFNNAFKYIHPEVNTGDDMFLMLYARQNFPGRLHFLKNPDAFVKTYPQPTWKQYFIQRRRWASKSTLYRNNDLIMISLKVLFIHIFLLAGLILSIINPIYIALFILLFSLKIIPDFLLLRSFLRYTGQVNLMKFFLPSQLINLLFIPLTGIIGIILPPERIPENEGA